MPVDNGQGLGQHVDNLVGHAGGVGATHPGGDSAPSTFNSLRSSGIWTWFTDPRAVIYNRKLYVGYTKNTGRPTVAQYNLDTHAVSEFELEAIQIDDHNNPALVVGSDGRITAFYSEHPDTTKNHVRTTTNPEDISAWDAVRAGPPNIAGTHGWSYSNPFYLSAESRLFMFFRGANFSPTMSYSDDGGVTWSSAVEVMTPPTNARPYVKYASNGVDRIDFWATHGHPRDYTPNHIVHFYYRAGNFYQTDGTLIKSMATLPFAYTAPNVVHNATNDGGEGWTWSIEYDAAGRPVCTYTVFPPPNDGSSHLYRCAWWDGSAWQHSEIVDGGPDIYPVGDTAEPQYSGGVIVDPLNTNRVYLSRPISGQWEIEARLSTDGRQTWPIERQITSGSSVKNARPYVPRGATRDTQRLLWWAGTYTSYSSNTTEIMVAPAIPKLPSNTVAPAVTGLTSVGQTLTCDTGTWTAYPTPTYTYQWRKNTVNIGGATSSTYVIQAGDAGASLDCRVTATNSEGAVTATSNSVTAGSGTVFVNDTFSGGSSVGLTAHTGETGATWTEHTNFTAGNFQVSAAGAAYCSASVGGDYASGTPDTADYDVAADFYVFSVLGSQGLMGRWSTSATTAYTVRYNTTGWELGKFVAGVFTQLGGGIYAHTPTVGQTYNIKLRMRGTTISALLDNVEILTATDSAISAAGVAGIRSGTGVTTSTGFHLLNFTATNA